MIGLLEFHAIRLAPKPFPFPRTGNRCRDDPFINIDVAASHLFIGFPIAHVERVRNNPGSGTQFAQEPRAQLEVDGIQQVEGDQIRLEMASPASPTLIRDPEDVATIYVLMPMRV